MVKRGSIPLNGIIRLMTFGAFAAGAAAGFFWGLEPENPEFSKLLSDVNVYVNALNPPSNAFSYFFGRTLQYGGTIALVWFLAYAPPFFLLNYGILFIRSYGLALTGMSLWNVLGTDGLIYAIALCGSQNLFWLPVLGYIVYKSVTQGLAQVRAGLVTRGPGARELGARIKLSGAGADYSFPLLLGLFASAAAAFIEGWITPVLLRYIYLV